MKIHLPNSAFLGNIDSFLRKFDPSEPKKLHITANPKWISVHPIVLTMIAALGQTVSRGKLGFEILEAKSKHYFERMGLFRVLGLDSGISITEHDSSGRFIPITQIQNSQTLSHFITEMIPLLHLAPIHAEPICYIVSELVRNVIEHADSKSGAFVAAQYYPNTNTIRIGICDAGVGITKTIRRSHHALDDLQAIRLALTPGITGTTQKEGGTQQNAGAGLFFVKSIAAVNGDFFGIYSGNAFYKLLRQNSKKGVVLNADPLDDRHSVANDYPQWQGVAIGIDMKLDAHERFTALLGHIRTVYAKAVRERKKVHYRKPKFI
ncbi:sensor histidine kinase [Candidatus Kaiserbacteria bacterium]|nr:sensor histidine kinase [Candidatus Kaiserbacteria bacterium]